MYFLSTDLDCFPQISYLPRDAKSSESLFTRFFSQRPATKTFHELQSGCCSADPWSVAGACYVPCTTQYLWRLTDFSRQCLKCSQRAQQSAEIPRKPGNGVGTYLVRNRSLAIGQVVMKSGKSVHGKRLIRRMESGRHGDRIARILRLANHRHLLTIVMHG